jgi:hypothetical protein
LMISGRVPSTTATGPINAPYPRLTRSLDESQRISHPRQFLSPEDMLWST